MGKCTIGMNGLGRFEINKGSYINYGMGGAGGSGIPYNSRESRYFRKRFFTCPFILPEDSENIDGLKLFAPPPLRDVSEKFCPPPFDQKIKNTPKPIKTPENIEFQDLKKIDQV